MKKILKYSIFMILVLVFCSSCDGDVTRDLRHAGFTVSDGKFECDAFFNSSNLSEKIRYITNGQIITEEGRIYDISLGQVYSNKANCKVADVTFHVKSIFDNKIIRADNGGIYTLTSDNNTGPYAAISSSDNSYPLYQLLLSGMDVVKVMTADSSNGIYYVLKTDGNVYGYTVSQTDRNTPSIVGSSIVYSSADYGGDIVDFNYAGDSPTTFVRTTSKVYRLSASNSKECSQYADVKCNYEMIEEPVFEKRRNSILAYNGSIILTDYQKIFTLGGES